MNYRCLNKNQWVSDEGFSLVPIREEDIESIRKWRNAQIEILRQNEPITKEEQKLYYKEHILPQFGLEKPEQILFSFLLDGKCIGYGGFTHIDWKSLKAELSFINDPERALIADFSRFLHLFLEIASALKLHKIIVETYAFRSELIALFESFGFVQTTILKGHVVKNGKRWDAYCHELILGES